MWEPLEPDLGLGRAEGRARRLKAALAAAVIALLLLGASTLDSRGSVQLAVQTTTAGGEK